MLDDTEGLCTEKAITINEHSARCGCARFEFYITDAEGNDLDPFTSPSFGDRVQYIPVPKPTKDGLLGKTERDAMWLKYDDDMKDNQFLRGTGIKEKLESWSERILKAQRDLTASECERNEAIAFETGKTEARIECQAKLKGIKEGVTTALSFKATIIVGDNIIIKYSDWVTSLKSLKAIWKEEGI